MNKQQRDTLRVRVNVKFDIGVENLLTAIAQQSLFSDVPSAEIVKQILDNFKARINDADTALDMVAYLDAERTKASATAQAGSEGAE